MTTKVFENKATYDQWDEDYYQQIALRHYDQAVDRILKYLATKDQARILDAGCGPGDHSIRMAKRGFQLQAIDISDAAVARAKQKAEQAGVAEKIRFDQGDLTHLSFPDASFDSIFCWGVVIHIPTLEAALKELVRVLRPGGRLAFQITNKDAWDNRLITAWRWVRRKPSLGLENKSLGLGRWYNFKGQQLWVWQVDIEAFTQFMQQMGCRPIARDAAEWTELHFRVPRLLRSPLLRLNSLWFRWRLPARPACTNIIVFEQQR